MRRLLSAIIAFSLVCTCFVVSSFAADREPVSIKDVILDYDMVQALDSYLLDAKLVDLTGKIPFVDMESAFWGVFDRMVSISGYGRFETYKDLLAACSAVNSYFNNSNPSIWDLDDIVDRAIVAECLNGLYKYTEWKVTPHYQYGYVISEVNTGAILCNSRGEFPYYLPDTITDPDSGEEVEDPALGGKWVRMDKVAGVKNVVSEAVLDDLVVALIGAGETVRYSEVEGKWKGIQSKTRFENGIPFVYCDSKSRQYVQQLDPDEFAVNNNQNIFIEDDDGDGIFDDGETRENQFIDIDSNTIWFPDGTFLQITNNLYDESTKSYYVDASSSYDIDNNYYYTYNYHYEYHIDYTSITYIGQTAEYDEVYEYYYQLPDGRSSADLTAEELQALNTQIDVLPYIRSADDTSIRALYHFDGDIRDSSYWSHLGEFTWSKGASITYMDAGAFGGALYLDENEHEFSIKLPSNIGSGDFTLQFRYYQSATLAPVFDSTLSIGGWAALGFNGSSLTTGSGSTVFAPVSVGNWQEICVMRKDGYIYRFLNGVPIYSASASTAVLNDIISFSFGDEQQTFKYFDEFRFVNEGIYSADGYTPSSVPHDTNLALVLPDSQLPVADEYWVFNDEGNQMLVSNYLGLGSLDEVYSSVTHLYNGSSYILNSLNRWTGVSNAKTSLVATDSFLSFVNSGATYSPYWNTSGSSSYTTTFPYNATTNAFVMPVGYCQYYGSSKFSCFYGYDAEEQYWSTSNYPVSQEYSFSILLASGESVSLNFTMDAFGNGGMVSESVWNSKMKRVNIPGGGRIIFAPGYYSDSGNGNRTFYYIVLCPPTGRQLDIVHAELKVGEPNTGHEFVSSVVVMDKDDLNTPSLAVRTDLDITGYQIGGVRPSLPTKGLVWALVEAGRISSLQIYNGQAWEEVDGRIWTGSRWVPYYAYDVLLLKDMWDIVEADPSLNPIYTEAGFWKWLQEAWGEMMKKLDQIAAGSGGSGSGSGETKSFWNRIADAFTTGLTALIEGVFSLITEILKTLLSLVTDMLSFLFSFIGETVLGGISDFFSAFTDGSLFDGFQQTDESGNTTTQLPEGVGAVFADISGMISALPAELLGVLVVGIALLFLLGVIMLIV